MLFTFACLHSLCCNFITNQCITLITFFHIVDCCIYVMNYDTHKHKSQKAIITMQEYQKMTVLAKSLMSGCNKFIYINLITYLSDSYFCMTNVACPKFRHLGRCTETYLTCPKIYHILLSSGEMKHYLRAPASRYLQM